MKISTSASFLFLTIFCGVTLSGVVSDVLKEVENWFETLSREKQPEKLTKLSFYFHDISGAGNVTSAVVARSNISFPNSFGVIYLADDPLTVGPEFASKRVGYLKGMYGTSSFEELSVAMATTFVFTDGIYNGSSLSIMGHNPVPHLYREIPVVGGSGRFRLARGVATFRTYLSNVTQSQSIFTVKVDIVVFHY